MANKLTKANKPHICTKCSGPILKGQEYEKITYPICRGGCPEYTQPDLVCLACVAKRKAWLAEIDAAAAARNAMAAADKVREERESR